MKKILLVSVSVLVSFCLMAQKVFRPTYFNFGLNLPDGNSARPPSDLLSVEENIKAGNWGAKQGYLFEFGTKIYFNKSTHRFRYGLDWTFISATYNPMTWNQYTTENGGAVDLPLMASVGSRLGPVFSYNIVDKLVVDLHGQVAPVLQFSPFNYYKENEQGDTEQEFMFLYDDIKDIYGGLKIAGGLGVRWGVIGISVDYFTGKLNSRYEVSQPATAPDEGLKHVQEKASIKSSSIQVKLSLNM